LIGILSAVIFPTVVLAAPNSALLSVYSSRPDLRKAFDKASNYRAAGTGAGYLVDLEDWARQYGWKEIASLSAYAPASTPPARAGHAAPPTTTASSYIVVDKSSGIVLVANHADVVWPIASLTKLMTAQLALDSGMALTKTFPVKAEDDVGGAKLYVSSGDTFTLDGLLYATLVGSANNAANALIRSTGKSKADFVKDMNARAVALNLGRTKYVDPTGIETGNVSTARELSIVAAQAFARADIKRYTTTAKASIDVLSQGTVKTIKNTNWMLWKPEYDDVFVTGGKTN
jgi:D-alanyl-D-alanine carboxypeptidase